MSDHFFGCASCSVKRIGINLRHIHHAARLTLQKIVGKIDTMFCCLDACATAAAEKDLSVLGLLFGCIFAIKTSILVFGGGCDRCFF